MRRIDRENAGGRGFRVLDPGGSGRYLEPLTPPPPPKAPEPYKVAPPSSSLGRAHRRSSFVIIAETRPATPSSRSPSPTLLATGRVSPFRGRGFKGPLPHAQSRPQSPENHQQGSGRRHGRFDRRTSVSQQSSPKRSLIPQPTRRRSVSLTKSNDRKPSPKFGRRAPVPRKNSNPGNANANGGGNISRRQSLRAPDLSPIQGTPTKPVEASARIRGGSSLITKSSPIKTRNTLTVPRNVGNTRRTSEKRSPSKGFAKTKRFVEEKKSNGENSSPTKIPMRRGSIVNKNGSTQSLSSNRNTGKPGKPGERMAKVENEPKQDSSRKAHENRGLRSTGNREGRKEDRKEHNDPPGSRFIEINSPTESKKREEDLGLIDLLKQSSGATGTSSVVNTTTTTAVQPLQIEAAGILLENDRAKTAEANNSKNLTPLPSPASRDVSPASALSPSIPNETSSLPKTPKVANIHQETSGSEKKPDSQESQVRSSTITAASNNPIQKNSSKGNATEEPTQTPNLSSNKKETITTNSKEKTKEHGSLVGTGTSKKNLLTKNGLPEGSRNEMRVPSASPGSRVNNSNNNNNNNNNNTNNSERKGSGKETSTLQENVETSGKLLAGKIVDGASSLTSGHGKSDSKSSVRSASSNGAGNGDAGKRTLSRNVGAVNTGKIESNVNTGVRATGNGDDGSKFRRNHGSETSLKSSNGLSTGSVDSIRSTDTGVSVNTVRGVSSAREKKGMHMMKKSEEIETLSGNLMHLERNGEPAVLDIAEAPEDPSQTELTRFGRFKKSLTGFYERLPSMRCLGCRRNQKGHPWPGDERNQTVQQQSELPENGANANTGSSRFRRVWTNLKNACRCMRLRECKCCRRAARVAPAESTPCCPPERRCGALCCRLFSRCKCCNRSEGQHTRSIRAKHSLTSVAPPPLSEEQRSKIPEVLVEHNSVMRGAIPCLPVPLAWFCLVWNVLLPGSGTVWSGLFNLCIGQPRFSITASPRARFGALVVDALVGVAQFFTVLFCLVGWGWSIWWGVTMIRLARKYKRFRASEAANVDAEGRGGDATGLPPGVPSQALRGMERAR